MKRLTLFLVAYCLFSRFSSPGFGQVTKSEVEEAVKSALSSYGASNYCDHYHLSQGDVETAIRRAIEDDRRREEARKQLIEQQIRRREIALGLRVMEPYVQYISMMFSDVNAASEKEIQHVDKNGSEAEALAAMQSTIQTPFTIQPKPKLFGPVRINDKPVFLWIGQTVYQPPDESPQPFLWVGYVENGQWNHAIALWGGKVLKQNTNDFRQIMEFLLEENSRDIVEQWERRFQIEHNRPWRFRSGVVVLGTAIGYQNGYLDVLEQNAAKDGKPRRILLSGLDQESQRAAFYYIWKNDLPILTKTLSFKNYGAKKEAIALSVRANMNDYQRRRENGKIGPKYNLLFWDMKNNAEIGLSFQVWRKEFGKEWDYLIGYINFLNGIS